MQKTGLIWEAILIQYELIVARCTIVASQSRGNSSAMQTPRPASLRGPLSLGR